MTDQSFSPNNLAKIYYENNKKGSNVSKLVFGGEIPEQKKIERVRKLIVFLLKKKDSYSKEIFREKLLILLKLRNHYKNQRKNKVGNKLNDVTKKIQAKKFDFIIRELPEKKNGKRVFVVNDDWESYFVEKKIQKNIKYGCHVKQADRDIIIPQLKSVLDNNFPKYIIKTDISSFYESIDREKLLYKINSRSELSLTTRKLIRKLLTSYETVSGEKQGVPRGIGVSAYLSELYLRDFDKQIREIPSLFYYARYVDDMILVLSPEENRSAGDLLAEIGGYLSNECLSLNSSKDKTKVYECLNDNGGYKFDFLGYSFAKDKNSLSIGLSKKKVDKYKAKLDSVFESFVKGIKRQPRRSRRELKLRLNFLTGNTKLSNNKGNALIGIYNSNKWITRHNDLVGLDKYLSHKISKVSSLGINSSIKSYSFKESFLKKRFIDVKPIEFSIIVNAWKKKGL